MHQSPLHVRVIRVVIKPSFPVSSFPGCPQDSKIAFDTRKNKSYSSKQGVQAATCQSPAQEMKVG